jgi:hypothetical protein
MQAEQGGVLYDCRQKDIVVQRNNFLALLHAPHDLF